MIKLFFVAFAFIGSGFLLMAVIAFVLLYVATIQVGY